MINRIEKLTCYLSNALWYLKCEEDKDFLEYISERDNVTDLNLKAEDYKLVKTALLNDGVQKEVAKNIKAKIRENIENLLAVYKDEAKDTYAEAREIISKLEVTRSRVKNNLFELDTTQIQHLASLIYKNEELRIYDSTDNRVRWLIGDLETTERNLKRFDITATYIIDSFILYAKEHTGSKDENVILFATNALEQYKNMSEQKLEVYKDTDTPDTENEKCEDEKPLTKKTFDKFVEACDVYFKGIDEKAYLRYIEKEELLVNTILKDIETITEISKHEVGVYDFLKPLKGMRFVCMSEVIRNLEYVNKYISVIADEIEKIKG